jgi:tetratricopeptide (TPR) repeat protein
MTQQVAPRNLSILVILNINYDERVAPMIDAPNTNVITAKRPLLTKLRSYITLIVALCCMIVLAVSAFLWFTYSPTAKQATPVNADDKIYANMQTSSKLLSASQHYDQAASDWISYAAMTPSKTHEANAFLNAAALYMSNAQYSKAVTMCQKAQAINGITFNEADEAANAYMLLGNKPEAIYYYRQTIKLMPADISDREAEIMSFEQAIQELQATS